MQSTVHAFGYYFLLLFFSVEWIALFKQSLRSTFCTGFLFFVIMSVHIWHINVLMSLSVLEEFEILRILSNSQVLVEIGKLVLVIGTSVKYILFFTFTRRCLCQGSDDHRCEVPTSRPQKVARLVYVHRAYKHSLTMATYYNCFLRLLSWWSYWDVYHVRSR